MTQGLFITILAVLTAAAGVALLVMTRRRQQRAREAAREKQKRENTADSAEERRRTIDDYAIPVGFDAKTGMDDEVDIGKICPACGARYASHHRLCQRCGDSELAALN